MKSDQIAKNLFCAGLIFFVFFAPKASAQDEAVAVRIGGREVFRVSGNEKTDAAARALQIEHR